MKCPWDAIDICGLTKKIVKCWGDNSKGQTDVPAGINKPVKVAVSDKHSCVVENSGVVLLGDNKFGQLDVPKFENN